MKKSAAVNAAIAEIDQKIGTLQAARQVLMSMNGAVEVTAPKKQAGAKRRISAAGRKRIAAAQKKRWQQKKQAEQKPRRPGRSPAKVLSAAG